jgi:hypothetical protein
VGQEIIGLMGIEYNVFISYSCKLKKTDNNIQLEIETEQKKILESVGQHKKESDNPELVFIKSKYFGLDYFTYLVIGL